MELFSPRRQMKLPKALQVLRHDHSFHLILSKFLSNTYKVFSKSFIKNRSRIRFYFQEIKNVMFEFLPPMLAFVSIPPSKSSWKCRAKYSITANDP